MQDDPSVPYGYCHCGCGRRTNLATKTSAKHGRVKGQPVAFVHGHSTRTRNVPACGYIPTPGPLLTDCWEWQLSHNTDGYGWRRFGGRSALAHVAFWTEANGQVPDGLELDHLCRNRSCVNPAHLEPVTHAENSRRGANATITIEDATRIRASPLSRHDAARAFGVGASLVAHARAGRTWTNQGDAT